MKVGAAAVDTRQPTQRWEVIGVATLVALNILLQLHGVEFDAFRGQDYFAHKTWITQAFSEGEKFLWTYGKNRSNPPLYHYLASFVQGWAPLTFINIVAYCNVALSAFGFLALYYIVRQVIANVPIRLAAFASIIFLPVVLIQSLVIASDALSTPLFFAYAAGMMAALRSTSRRNFYLFCLLVSFSLAAGVLTKFTFLSQVIAALTVFVWSAFRGRLSWQRALVAIVLVVVPAAGLGQWQMKLYREQSTYSLGLSGARSWSDLQKTDMPFRSVGFLLPNDYKLLSAPQFLDTVDAKPILLQPHSFSFPALLHYGTFTDFLNIYQFDPFNRYSGLRMPKAQTAMALAVKSGLWLSLLALCGLLFHFGSAMAALLPRSRFEPNTVILVVAGLGWFLNIALFLPFVNGVYGGTYWHPRLVVPALACFIVLGFLLVEKVGYLHLRWVGPVTLLFAVMQGSLQARFMWPIRADVSQFVEWNHDQERRHPEFLVEYLEGQGMEGSPDDPFFWVGESLGVLVRREDESMAAEDFVFSAVLAPGPADPSPLRKVAIHLPDLSTKIFEITSTTPVRIPVRLNNGRNLIRIEILSPKVQKIYLPGDGRFHALHVSKVRFELREPSSGSSRNQARDLAPFLSVRNPQGADGQPGGFWYWLGQSMEFEIENQQDSFPRALYELRFTVSRGPGMKKLKPTIEIIQSSVKTKSVVIDVPVEIVVPLRLHPGANSVRLESPASNEVRLLKGDPRLLAFSVSQVKLVLVRAYEKQPANTILDHGPFPTPPKLTIANPQGSDGPPSQPWYWVGPPTEIKIVKFDQPKIQFGYRLKFRMDAGPGDPNPNRVVVLADSSGHETAISFVGVTDVDLPIRLWVGENTFRLIVRKPSRNMILIPSDPRVLTLRLSGAILVEPVEDTSKK